MSGPSNIKIQKTGAEEVGNAEDRLPASDLERSAAQRRCLAWPQGLAGAWAA